MIARLLRTSLVIARRDFMATVVSRTFLLFLAAPLLPVLFGAIFGAIESGRDEADGPPLLTLSAPAGEASAIMAVHRNLDRARLAPMRLHPMSPLADIDDTAQAGAMLADPLTPMALLASNGRRAVLWGDEKGIAAARAYASLLLTQAAERQTLSTHGLQAAPATLAVHRLTDDDGQDRDQSRERRRFARSAQTGLFVLTLMLAGVLISNFVEEKANKVIEVLAAAAPMPAIFAGKLLAMLGASLVGLAAWGVMAVTAFWLFAPQMLADVPAPAVGWTAFALLGLAYFTVNYLLIGAVLLAVGAQASSIRQIQTLSLPITVAQLVLYGMAGIALMHDAPAVRLAVALFPYSSPLAMIGRAGLSPTLWPHLAALCWQLLWVAITIALAARWFRKGVLKTGSGGPALPFGRRHAKDQKSSLS